MAGLRLEHIYKVYANGTKAVSDFTMDIEDQEFIVFVGPSGCGKSTTLRMIAGLEEISAGELYIGDSIVNDVEPKDRDIAMVFQNYALYPHMTVYENLAFGLKLRNVASAEIHEKVLWAAKVLDLTEYLDRKPRAMSGGQRQRVALGRAILRNPKVMLLDEPLSNLDAKLRAQMRSEIAKLHEDLKTTFIYVTHDQVEAMTLGTRVVVMRLGKIMQIDTPKNLYDYPNNLFVAGFIGTPQMNFFQAKLIGNKEMIKIKFLFSNAELEVPHSKLSKVQHQYLNGDKTVIVGLRCEDLSLDPEVVKNSSWLIDVRISHFEELGDETLIYSDINENGDGFKESSTRAIIKGRSNYNLVKGSIVKAAVDIAKIHIFDKETEQSINPRIPVENLIPCEISKGDLKIGQYSCKLPKVINLADGEYDILIPTQAISLTDDEQGQVSVASVEEVGGVTIVGLNVADRVLFTTFTNGCEVKDQTAFELDFTQIEFIKDGNVVFNSIAAYDKVNAIFLNYSTAKRFVGTKYEGLIAERVQKVKDIYEPQLAALKKQYEADVAKAQKVDSKAIASDNQKALSDRKNELNKQLADLKNEFKTKKKELDLKHANNNTEITNKVMANYAKIKEEELSAFESFKAINRDRDAYRKRLMEIKEFKNNIGLERNNELEKQLNLEAVNYESDLNAIKGSYRRTVEGLKKAYNDFVLKCRNEEYPLKAINANYKKELTRIKVEYQDQLDLAYIIFFFKTNDLITLSTDSISNKMIQGLGFKVFTKQYLLEIPHDAYYEDEEGLEVKVEGVLDYGKKQFLHCVLDDGSGLKNLYLESVAAKQDSKTIRVKFDISKIHITEKSMEIKIY